MRTALKDILAATDLILNCVFEIVYSTGLDLLDGKITQIEFTFT